MRCKTPQRSKAERGVMGLEGLQYIAELACYMWPALAVALGIPLPQFHVLLNELQKSTWTRNHTITQMGCFHGNNQKVLCDLGVKITHMRLYCGKYKLLRYVV